MVDGECSRICVLGMRRTGSNHLFQVLRNFADLASCGELFNRDKVSGVQALLSRIRQLTGTDWMIEKDDILKAYARGNPAAFLEIVDAAATAEGKHCFCFKVFADQLDRPTIESAILAHPRTHMILLARRSLDSYVSLQKAQRSDEWVGVETTEQPIALDAEAFAAWLEDQRSWYRHWLAWAERRRKPAVVLTYDADVDRPRRIILWRFARAVRAFGVTLRQPLRLRIRGLPRQDRTRDVAARVANWPEFSAGLRRLGLERDAHAYPL